MMAAGNGQVSVPPGFRFHPTDEELLYYYLRKKVAYEAIDLDVIRDVDLNKLEPWDLKEKCRIGSGPQNEWYFFSHKDKKYPTGTRTNRATMAGFWKATGRDKDIHLSNAKRIGMRKTLVFYIGRAPNGQKTEWIMHEYRLNEDNPDQIQEDGWVVCRLFKKKILQREVLHPDAMAEELQFNHHMKTNNNNNHNAPSQLDQNFHHQIPWEYTLDNNSMQLPQLLSTESAAAFAAPFNPSNSLDVTDIECSQNLIKLMGVAAGGGGGGGGTDAESSAGTLGLLQHERLNGDWSILDKLLASHQNLDQLIHGRGGGLQSQQVIMNTAAEGVSAHKFPFQYLGCEGGEMLKIPK